MQPTVLIPAVIGDASQPLFAKAGINVITVPTVDAATLVQYGQQADGAILGLEPIPEATFAKTPRLKILARLGVGYNNVNPTVAKEHGVIVSITPRANYNTVAEGILAMIFVLGRNLMASNRAIMSGHWPAVRANGGHDILGQTLGIIGYGRIGRALEEKAAALGMKILVNNGDHPKQPRFGQLVDLPTLYRESDFISLTPRVTPQTTGMINKDTLALMKPTANLINYGRGQLIVTDDLVAALKHHQIHAAALDTFDPEPLPADSPLLQLDNVFLTPHVAGGTIEANARAVHDATEEIIRVLSGHAPLWAVNA